MTQSTYTSENLPLFIPGTSGTAMPKPGPTVAVCVAPEATTITRPKSWGAGQDLDIAAGVHHIAQDAEGDSYPNQEFSTFYELQGDLDPADDARAKFLVDFWADRGHEVDVQLAAKVRSAVVLGTVVAEAAGATFQNHEGTTELLEGSMILQSPDDDSVRWAITKKVYDKKYQPVQTN